MKANKDGTKYCPQCKQTKPIIEFNRDKKRVDGLKCYCKQCRRNNYLKKQSCFCKKNQEYIKENKIRAFRVIANGNKIECRKHKEWNCCGNPADLDFLSFDHIKGDGAEHRRKIKATASSSLHRWIIKNPKEARNRIQILCMNAQVKKKKLNKEQRYERRTD